jgi:hypothetical protein
MGCSSSYFIIPKERLLRVTLSRFGDQRVVQGFAAMKAPSRAVIIEFWSEDLTQLTAAPRTTDSGLDGEAADDCPEDPGKGNDKPTEGQIHSLINYWEVCQEGDGNTRSGHQPDATDIPVYSFAPGHEPHLF